MKKLLKFSFFILLFMLVAATAIPYLFKDELKIKVEQLAEENLNADVYFKDFGLSIFKNFPNITASLENFGIVGIAEFEKDTLLSAESLGIEIDIKSIISGKYRVGGVYLDAPRVKARVNTQGNTNWEALYTPTEVIIEDTTISAPLKLDISSIVINDGKIIYHDQTLPLLATLTDVDYDGGLSIDGDLYDLANTLAVGNVQVIYNRLNYFDRKRLFVDMVLAMNLIENTYSFKENTVKINDLALVFDGFVKLLESGNIDLDANFSTKETTIKNILSVIPTEFTKEYESIKTTGKLAFNGQFKGLYGENSFPMSELSIKILDGSIKYPDLALPIENINVDVTAKNVDKVGQKFLVDLKKFSLNAAGNPVFATSNSVVTLDNNSELSNVSTDTYIKAALDLKKVTEVYPLDDILLSGQFNTELSAKGDYNELSEKIPDIISKMNMKNIYYKQNGDDIAYKLTKGVIDITPSKTEVKSFDAVIGKSALSVTGYITDYLNYFLGNDKAVLKGSFNLASDKLDLNQFMVEEEGESETDEEPLEVVQIPSDLDLTFNSTIDQLIYTDLTMNQFKGDVTVQDGLLKLDKTKFDIFGGSFLTSGNYDSRDKSTPKYDMQLNIDNMKIQQAYKAFATIQKLVPAAEKMDGDFSTDFNIAGNLTQEMMPDYNTINGEGVVDVVNAKVKDLKVLKAVSKVSSLNNLGGEHRIGDKQIEAELKNGRLFFSPITMNKGGKDLVLSGNQGIDGTIDYKLTTEAPASAVSELAKKFNKGDGKLNINIGLKGTYDSPKPTVLGISSGKGEKKVQQVIKDEVKTEVTKKKEEVKAEVKKKAEEKAKDLLKKLF
ncbi:MAG: AsmA family protein [Cyclobacteriaceae bacterium]